MTDIPVIDGPVEITLSDEMLAQIGRATAYEAQAKTFLSLSLKVLSKLDHEQWIEVDKKPFEQIVRKITTELIELPRLKALFETIEQNHKRWREGRNFVVHTIWGQGSDGEPVAYCYRRKLHGDENDIVRAVNDCFWLAKKARIFQYEVALMISDGILQQGSPDGAGVSVRTPTGLARF